MLKRHQNGTAPTRRTHSGSHCTYDSTSRALRRHSAPAVPPAIEVRNERAGVLRLVRVGGELAHGGEHRRGEVRRAQRGVQMHGFAARRADDGGRVRAASVLVNDPLRHALHLDPPRLLERDSLSGAHVGQRLRVSTGAALEPCRDHPERERALLERQVGEQPRALLQRRARGRRPAPPRAPRAPPRPDGASTTANPRAAYVLSIARGAVQQRRDGLRQVNVGCSATVCVGPRPTGRPPPPSRA